MPTLEERVAALEAQTPRRLYTSIWSGEEIDRRLLNAAGRNLLDNAYWAAKEFIINQRGLLEYTGTSITWYGMDRWKCYGGVQEKITDDGVFFSGGWGTQEIAPELLIPGYPYTLSVFGMNGVEMISVYNDNTGQELIPGQAGGDGPLIVHTFTVPEAWRKPDNTVQARVGFWGTNNQPLLAAKLELGSVSTLAHKDAAGNWVLNDPPPDYGLELIKCQRYQICFGDQNNYEFFAYGLANNTNILSCLIPLPTTLMGNPAISISGEVNASIDNATFINLSNMQIIVNAISSNMVNLVFKSTTPVFTIGQIYNIICFPGAKVIIDKNL